MTVVNVETGELVEPMTADEARRLTERIRIAASNYTDAKAKVLLLVDEAKAGLAHVALGYKSWSAYLTAVLSDEPLRLARDERPAMSTRLADEGMSTRAIAGVLGVTHATVQRDLAEPTGTNVPVLRETEGLDGRIRVSVTAGQMRTPPRRALPDQFFDAAYDTTKRVESLHRLISDDRFTQNAEKVAAKHRSDLLRTSDLLAQVINALPEQGV